MNTNNITRTIVDFVLPHKKRSERLVGYVPYDLKFEIRRYRGLVQKPEKISILEKTIVRLIDKGINDIRGLASCLGLDIADQIENEMISSSLEVLRSHHKLVEGNITRLSLTEAGEDFIKKGFVVKIFSGQFELYIDPLHPDYLYIPDFIEENTKFKIGPKERRTENLSLSQIQKIAEYQATNVQYSENGLNLISADLINVANAELGVYLCFVQSIRDNSIRTIAYDAVNNNVIEQLSSLIDNDENMRDNLLKQCLKNEVVKEGVIEVDSGDKTFEQIEVEKRIIEEADLKGEVVDEIKSNHYDDKVGKVYDSVEFENELNDIFETHHNEEIWLISPWIKNYAFLGTREPQIRRFLDQGGAIFIGYSEPERAGEEMVDPMSMSMVQRLNRCYDKFYYMELPKFHMKNVIEYKNNVASLYSGSFNILSFCINGSDKHYRMEQMIYTNLKEATERRKDYLLMFAEEYVKQYTKEIQSAESHIKIDFSKLNYLRKLGVLSEAIKNIENLAKESNINVSTMHRPNETAMIRLSHEVIASTYSSDTYQLQAKLSSILYLFVYANDKKDGDLKGKVESELFHLLQRASIYKICRFCLRRGKNDANKSIVNIICNGLNFEFGELSLPPTIFKSLSKHKERIRFKEENIKDVKYIITEVLYNSIKSTGMLNNVEKA